MRFAISPSGMCFAIASNVSSQTAKIISLLVLPEFRRQGIGTKLLVYLEKELKKQGTQELTLAYESSHLTRVALEKILKKLEWRSPIGGEFRQTGKLFY